MFLFIINASNFNIPVFSLSSREERRERVSSTMRFGHQKRATSGFLNENRNTTRNKPVIKTVYNINRMHGRQFPSTRNQKDLLKRRCNPAGNFTFHRFRVEKEKRERLLSR